MSEVGALGDEPPRRRPSCAARPPARRARRARAARSAAASPAPGSPRFLHGLRLQDFRQPVERPPEPRVDGAARKLERAGDLAGRVVEQVAQRDDRPLLGPQLAQRLEDLVREREPKARRVGPPRSRPRPDPPPGGAPALVPRRSRGSPRSGASRARTAAAGRSGRARAARRGTPPGRCPPPRPRRGPRGRRRDTPAATPCERAPRPLRPSRAARRARGGARAALVPRRRPHGRAGPTRPARRAAGPRAGPRSHWPQSFARASPAVTTAAAA